MPSPSSESILNKWLKERLKNDDALEYLNEQNFPDQKLKEALLIFRDEVKFGRTYVNIQLIHKEWIEIGKLITQRDGSPREKIKAYLWMLKQIKKDDGMIFIADNFTIPELRMALAQKRRELVKEAGSSR